MKTSPHTFKPQFLQSSQKDFSHVTQNNKHDFIEGIGKVKGDTLKAESVSSQRGEGHHVSPALQFYWEIPEKFPESSTQVQLLNFDSRMTSDFQFLSATTTLCHSCPC